MPQKLKSLTQKDRSEIRHKLCTWMSGVVIALPLAETHPWRRQVGENGAVRNRK
jgi:hypothetical protein